MAKTPAERMRTYRERQRASGITLLTLAVPSEDVELFTAFAEERRERRGVTAANAPPLRPQTWFSMMETDDATCAVAARATRAAGTPQQRAERLAHALLRHIIEAGWPVGRPLAPLAELKARYGASASVLRQALRLLAHHGVVTPGLGEQGPVVGNPDSHVVARAASIYLEYRRIGPAAILFTRRTLELAALRLAIENLDASGEQRLRQAMEAESGFDGNTPPEEMLRLHLLIGELSLDPALQLFGGVVLLLSVAHSSFLRLPPQDRNNVIARLRRLHGQIVDAMIERDVARATRRMDRYFDGMRDWLV